MLSFISFWRAAAIVLSDLASSAYYVGGIAETAIGKSAPWFILSIMLFSYAVRAVYIESCSMFVRGGVYRVVHEAMGGTLAKFSVSALMFDYVLTGPISGVSAGLYAAGLLNDTGGVLSPPRPGDETGNVRGYFRRDRDHLFLAQEYHRYSRIQPEGSAHHADHHGYGGHFNRLVPRDNLHPRVPASAATVAGDHSIRFRCAGLAAGIRPCRSSP